ncbi:MAG: methylmalonyl Co-A mutase-associated GTPase MeaB [Acidimicrobiales bacterium]
MPPARSNDPQELFAAAREGDHASLARLLSLIERGGAPARQVAAIAYRSKLVGYTVGMTGAPGAGKSTLTDRLIGLARRGLPGGDDPDAAAAAAAGPDLVGVLAIDPTSPFSGGAILGDRVRMPSHSVEDGVLIRSMATRGQLGGLAVAVPDAVRVLSASGFPVILIETVGVGQQEVEVASATDTTVVVVNPGWGDSIQANKAGLMEIADLFVINKADRAGTRQTHRDLDRMLDMTELAGWRPPIVETVASTGDGVDEVWEAIGSHRHHLIGHGLLDGFRRQRLEREFRQILVARVEQRIRSMEGTESLGALMDALDHGDVDPYEAADRLLEEMALSDPGLRSNGVA